MKTPILNMHDVCFSYERAPVLENVSIEIGAHSRVAIVGPNGGGKSTLLKLMLGLINPTRGTVRMLGQAPRKACKRIGYMPQQILFDPKFPITVREVVGMGRLGQRMFNVFGRADRLATDRALDEVGMLDAREQQFADLSGGQRQRVLIARALACDPEVLLLDEPTAMVDAVVEAKLLETLQDLHRNMSIFIVSHDLGFVSNMVDRVLCINRTAVVHPVSEITGETISEIYGSERVMIRHDHNCTHDHDAGHKAPMTTREDGQS